MAAPQVGQIVGERYRLEEWLESGAMGSVWRAEQIRLRSAAAIKFLDASLIEVPEMLERFLLEARSAAAVHSAHVIQVFDYGSDAGLPYIAMEFLDGENLAARLARRGTLTPAELDKIFSEVARGLGQAHELGVIHRDVKPANIFLAREGKHEVTKLIDFGIAKVRADALRVSQVVGTQLGTLLGTPQYMSPEQMRGRGTLDSRTDLWALAIIACECLTGRQAFSGTTIGDLTVQICTEDPLAPSALGDVPAGFDQWFFKATCKDPNGRFESATDMADALTQILALHARAPASVRSRAPGSALRAWSAPFRSASSHVARRAALAFESARAVGSTSIERLRTTAGSIGRAAIAEPVAVLVTRASRTPEARGLWSRAAAVGLGLTVVAGALVLLQRPRSSPGPKVQTSVASQALERPARLEATLPVSPTPALQLKPAALPVLESDELPVLPETEVGSTPTNEPKPRRRGKRQNHAAPSRRHAPAPLNPMSEGMRRINALIAGANEERRPARSGNADQERARQRGTKAE